LLALLGIIRYISTRHVPSNTNTLAAAVMANLSFQLPTHTNLLSFHNASATRQAVITQARRAAYFNMLQQLACKGDRHMANVY
jgi:hypothetical protein